MTPTFSASQVNLFLLRKQRLLASEPCAGLPGLLQATGGLHATTPTTPYLSLFARCTDFLKADLDADLYGSNALGRIRCMRKTIYILPRDLLPAAWTATHSMVENASRRFMEAQGVSAAEYASLSSKIAALLQGKEMSARAIKASLGTSLNVPAVLNLMCDQGLLLRGRPGKSWKDHAFRYRLFAEAFPGLDLDSLSEPEAVRQLVEFYLHAYGPATQDDIAWWTGLAKGKVQVALDALRDSLAAIRVQGLEAEYRLIAADLPGLEGLVPPPGPIVSLLPTLDHWVMGYKDRRRYLDPQHLAYAFDFGGNATYTILIDGRISGVWDCDGELVKLLLFHPVPSGVMQCILDQARLVGRFITEGEVKVKICDRMTPLTRRTAGGVMTPLKGS